MYGIDISNHQRKIDLSQGSGKFDFAVIKASEGIWFQDNSYLQFANELVKMDKLIGVYHFARPDLHGTVEKMREEADWFIQCVEKGGLLGKAILVLDWETEPMDKEDLLTAWVDRVVELTRITPFIYGSRSKLGKWIKWNVMNRCPIWMAVWPSIGPLDVGAEYTNEIDSKGVEWDIWQYSANGRFPGYGGNVDLDVCKWDREWWMMKARGDMVNEEETLSEDMKWAIEKGLFVGYGDGRYGGKDYLTREQLATVLRRVWGD